jgi:hypothetical protein
MHTAGDAPLRILRAELPVLQPAPPSLLRHNRTGSPSYALTPSNRLPLPLRSPCADAPRLPATSLSLILGPPHGQLRGVPAHALPAIRPASIVVGSATPFSSSAPRASTASPCPPLPTRTHRQGRPPDRPSVQPPGAPHMPGQLFHRAHDAPAQRLPVSGRRPRPTRRGSLRSTGDTQRQRHIWSAIRGRSTARAGGSVVARL